MEIFHNDWAEFLNPELKKPYCEPKSPITPNNNKDIKSVFNTLNIFRS